MRQPIRIPHIARWPIGMFVLVLLLASIGAWRGAHGAARGEPVERGPVLEERRFGDLRLTVPSDWRTLDRSGAHVTWGSADRSHTVTLGWTEASVLPLPGVVAAMARESVAQLPGARIVRDPSPIELDGAPRQDSAMLVELRVEDARGVLAIQQAWRRDVRAGLDLVATWTSSDGSWPVSPETSIPHANATR